MPRSGRHCRSGKKRSTLPASSRNRFVHRDLRDGQPPDRGLDRKCISPRHKWFRRNRSGNTQADRKVVLLAGAAHGIGRAAALRIVGKGHILAACDKDEAGLEQLKTALPAGCDAFLACADITELSAVTEFVNTTKARYGRIDAAIGNAGGMISLVADGLVEANIRNFLDIPTTDWRAIVDLNLYGSLNLSRAVLPVMVEQGQAGWCWCRRCQASWAPGD